MPADNVAMASRRPAPTHPRPAAGRAARPAARAAAAPAGESLDSVWRGLKERSAQAREIKRETVILAAARAFATRGIAGTSMDQLAATLSVTKPTIYRTVGDKEAVLRACEQRMNERFLDALRQAEAAGGTGLRKALDYQRRSLELIETDDFGRLVLVLGGTGDPFGNLSDETRAMREQVQSRIRGWLAADRRAGLLRPAVDLKIATLALFAVFNFIPRWFRPGGPSPLDAIYEHNRRLFVWALTDQPRAHGFDD